MLDPRVSVSVILPVRNGASPVAELVARARAVPMDRVIAELLVINEGSSDAREAGQDLAEHVDVFEHQAHRSRDVAVRKGVSRALGEVILLLDSDGGYDPNDYPKVLEPILAGEADVVLGRRLSEVGSGYTAFRVEVLEDKHVSDSLELESGLLGGLSNQKWRIQEVGLG
jgi:glycosyltransferase involved in cell wall biosynthesis